MRCVAKLDCLSHHDSDWQLQWNRTVPCNRHFFSAYALRHFCQHQDQRIFEMRVCCWPCQSRAADRANHVLLTVPINHELESYLVILLLHVRGINSRKWRIALDTGSKVPAHMTCGLRYCHSIWQHASHVKHRRIVEGLRHFIMNTSYAASWFLQTRIMYDFFLFKLETGASTCSVQQ